MNPVSCKVLLIYIHYLDEKNIPLKKVLKKLEENNDVNIQFSESFLRRRANRVPWNYFVAFHTAVGEVLKQENWEETLVEYSYSKKHEWLNLISAIVKVLFDPAEMYYMAHRWNLNALFANLISEYKELPDGRIYFNVVIPKDDVDSPGFYRMSKFVLERLPRVMNLEDAKVSLQISDRQGEYFVTPPTAHLSFF